MEVNNNDPNNNDVVVVDHMDAAVNGANIRQSVSGSSISWSHSDEELDTLNSNISLSDEYHSNGHSSQCSKLVEKSSNDWPLDYHTDYIFDDDNEELNESDEEQNQPETIDEEIVSDSDDASSEQPIECENDDFNIVHKENAKSETLKTIQDEPILIIDNDELHVKNEITSNSSNNTSTLFEDYHVIKKIAPNLNDSLIFECLRKNENYDNRVLASLWDMMHIISKPLSKTSRVPLPIFSNKQLKTKNDNRVHTNLEKSGINVIDNVKLISPPKPVSIMKLHRKDYNRLPKRSPQISEFSLESQVETKKRKSNYESFAPNTSILSPAKLNFPNILQPTQNQIVAEPSTSLGLNNKEIKVMNVNQQIAHNETKISGGMQWRSKQQRHDPFSSTVQQTRTSPSTIPVIKTATQTNTIVPAEYINYDQNKHPVKMGIFNSKFPMNELKHPYDQSNKSNTHVKVSSKRLAGYLISACQNAIPSTAITNSIIRPATLSLQSNKEMISTQNVKSPEPSTSSSVNDTKSDNPVIITIADQPNNTDPDEFTEQDLILDIEQELEKIKNKTVFNQLTTMFEKVRREYIIKLCLKYEAIMEGDFMLNHLIDILLMKGHSYEKNDVKQIQTIQDMYNDLLEIFPDANPEYLRTHASKYINDSEQFLQFVQSNLENRNYPTKQEYLKNQKIRTQMEQYITNFNVVQFLDVFPKPFEYFENPNRCSNPELSLNYLKTYYSKVRMDTIQKMFRRCYQNLTLTVKELDKIKDDMKSKRSIQLTLTEDIPFTQEIAFIRHRKEIEDYIKFIENNEKIEFETLKKNGKLLECQCCFNNECIPSKSSYCENGHLFCYPCIIKGTECIMANGDTHIKCFVECSSEFSLSVLQKVLQPSKFSILLNKRQEAEVKAAGLEGLVSCPFCHFASIPPAEDKIFKCLNQDCMKESCRSCKELNHVPLSCEEAKATDKARHFLEERMTEALIRICYKCKKPFFKEEGCNKMTCTCGAIMCYICGQPVKDYYHFRGQGSDALELCPLYTDDVLMNAAVVRRAAENTAKNLMAKDPNVKLEAEKLMPALPTPKIGPHNQIVHPFNLPEQALRARPYTDNQ